MKKGNVGVTKLIVILIAVAFIVLVIPSVLLGGSWSRILNIIPNYNETHSVSGDAEILRYDIAGDKVQYYDGTAYVDFPKELGEEIRIGTKNISHNAARYYFADNYYYRPDLRDKSLEKFSYSTTSDVQITSILNYQFSPVKIEPTELGLRFAYAARYERGTVFAGFKLKDVFADSFGNIFRVGRTASDIVYFRYSTFWEWSPYPHKDRWKAIDKNIADDPNYFSGTPLTGPGELRDLIVSLAGKNFEQGKELLLLPMKNSLDQKIPNTYLVNVQSTSGGESIVGFRFNNEKWEWSIGNGESWASVHTDTLNGIKPSSEIQQIIAALRDKNLEDGKKLLYVTEKDNSPNMVNNINGRLILTPKNSLLYQGLDAKGELEDPISANDNPELKGHTQRLLSGMMEWRDSILSQPMQFKYNNNKECILVKVQKTANNQKVYLAADLVKDEVGKC